jgi:hypothetical protein
MLSPTNLTNYLTTLQCKFVPKHETYKILTRFFLQISYKLTDTINKTRTNTKIKLTAVLTIIHNANLQNRVYIIYPCKFACKVLIELKN